MWLLMLGSLSLVLGSGLNLKYAHAVGQWLYHFRSEGPSLPPSIGTRQSEYKRDRGVADNYRRLARWNIAEEETVENLRYQFCLLPLWCVLDFMCTVLWVYVE